MRGAQAVFGLVMIVVGIVMFPMVMTAFHQTLTDEDTVQASVTTGAGETTGTVALAEGLYNDALTSVVSIHSTEDTDVPQASSYSSSGKQLTVSGLAESQTRTLTVTYEYEAGGEFTGFTDFGKLGPLILLLCFIGGGVGLVVSAFRR